MAVCDGHILLFVFFVAPARWAGATDMIFYNFLFHS